MGKRIYFICSSVITFILSVVSMITAKEFVAQAIETMKETYKMFPEDFQNRIISIYEKAGVKLTIVFAIFVIIISIFLFVFAINNTLLRHKGLVITLSILMLFFTDSVLCILLAIANFIVILCCKRKNPEDFPDKTDTKLVKLELKKCKIEDYFLSIILVLAYFSQFIWSRYLPEDFLTRFMIEITFNLIMMILCGLVFSDVLKFNFKVFNANFGRYMRFIMSRIGIAYLFLFVASLISMVISKNAVSVNQEALENLPLYYTLPAAIIYAPFVEEIIFRGVFRRFIKNNLFFILISGVVFGVLHTIGESSIFNILVMALPYSVLGCYLAYIYTKTNNIFVSIANHSIFNAVASIFLILI